MIFSEVELAQFLNLSVWQFKEYGPEGCINSSYLNMYYEKSNGTVSESFSFKDSFSFYINREDLKNILKSRSDYDYWKEVIALETIITSLKENFPKEKIFIKDYSFIAFTHLFYVCSKK